MGEVYRGRDTRLGREVALKVISPKRVGDADLRRRFELEARAASVLNHPSIVTIYDVGETNGVSWIAMEWVEGRTLREVLSDGPLPMRDALTIGRQIAEGLSAAHGKGIVHRDLKPENVMVGRDGRTKILDFGLARRTFVDTLWGTQSKMETAAPPPAVTGEGVILGTVGYMSPEQASGLPADARSDQFALGLIVYEMVTGLRAFSCPTAVETLAAIIKEEPPSPSSLRHDVPPAVESLIARCLAKRPQERFGSAKEVAAADATGPATLRTIRLSASNPPMSVIFDLSKPVQYDKHIENGPGYSTVKVLLKDVTPDANIQHHLVFDRSIFKDCDISSDAQGTTVTVNTVPVSSFAVVPLSEPPRLLVTFTSQGSASN